MQVFVVRADYGAHTQAFKDNGYAGIGWFEDVLAEEEKTNKEKLRTAYELVYPDHKPGRAAQNVSQIYRFLNEVEDGDVVLTPYNDSRMIAGRVVGKSYAQTDTSSPCTHRIKVKWNKQILNRKDFSIPLQNTLRSMLTVFRVNQIGEVCQAAGFPYDGDDPISVARKKVKEQDYYEPIRNLLLELDDKEFEVLVSYLLQTMGFSPTKDPISTRGADGGTDFEGELNVQGIATIFLQVQVKRYKQTNKVQESAIRNFRGALKRDAHACFITLSSYSKKAKNSANDPDKVPIQLVNGDQFIDILTAQYDHVIDLLHTEDQDELANKLNFKKVLVPG